MTTMIEVKTADLIWPALDWAVAKVEALEVSGIQFGRSIWVRGLLPSGIKPDTTLWEPSTNWAQGGPLIERLMKTGCWEIAQGTTAGTIEVRDHDMEGLPLDGESYHQAGEFVSNSLLVAVCRATVWMRCGDVVSVPAELVGGGV